MQERGIRLWTCAAVGALLLSGAAHFAADNTSRDWPQFRGVNRDGISSETGLLTSWPSSGPKEIWRRPIGEGYSGITIVDGRIYTMYGGEDDGKAVEFAAAFDAQTGKELWHVVIGDKYETQFGNGPRSTPAVDGDLVYFIGSRGDFAALSIVDGSETWSMSLPEKFGASQPYFGFAASTLLDDGQLIIEGGGKEGKSFAGLDKMTGEVKWTSGDGGREPSYNSAIAVEIGGRRHFVYVVGKTLRGIDSSGQELWSHEWPEGETHASPVFISPNRIFTSGVEGVGGILIEIKDDGEKVSVNEVWKTRFMRNHFSTSLVHDDHIYGFDNATLKCIAAADAKMAWRKRGLGKGSLIYADGHILVLSDQGRLLLVEATSEGYVEKGSVQALEGKSWTAPTLAGGTLYLRNHTEMVAYDING